MGDLDRFELSHITSLIFLLPKIFQLSDFPIFRLQDLGSLMNVIIRYLRFYYYHWVDTSAGGLLVPEGIIHPVVTVSVLTWFIRYLCFYCYHWIYTSAGGLLVPRGIIRPVVSVSILTDCIGYLRFYHYLLVDHYFPRESPTR